MTTPKLETVMAAIATVVANITDGAVPTPNPVFNYVTRQVIIGQNLQTAQKPACGIQRLMDRNDRRFDTATSQKNTVIVQLQITGSQTNKELIDTELVSLKEYLDNALLNNTLGGLVSAITYFGADSSNFVAIPQGSELITYEFTLAKPKPSFPNG